MAATIAASQTRKENFMNRWGVFLAAVLAAAALLLPPPVAAKAPAKVEKEIKAVLKKHGDYFKAKNLDGVMSLYAQEPDVISIGSEESEEAIGLDQIRAAYKKSFAAISALNSMSYKNLRISAAGNAAWIYTEVKISLVMANSGRPLDINGRFTAVLKKKGNQWRFVQTHFSEIAKPVILSFEEIDVNKDGKIDYKEMTVVITGLTPEQFRAMDRNKDGVITRDEYSGYMSDEEMKAVWSRPHNIF